MKNKIDKNLTSAQGAPEINEETLRSALELLTPTEEETRGLRAALMKRLDEETAREENGLGGADFRRVSARKPSPRRIAYAGGGLAACLCVVMLVTLISNGEQNKGGVGSADGSLGITVDSDADSDGVADSGGSDYDAYDGIDDSKGDSQDSAMQEAPEYASPTSQSDVPVDNDNGAVTDAKDAENASSCEIPQNSSIIKKTAYIKGLPTTPSTWGIYYESITTRKDDLPSVYMPNDINEFYLSTQRVAIVRVDSVEDVGERKFDDVTTMLSTQISKLSVLMQMGDQVPGSLKLTQYLAEGCDPDGVSNLVRKGGVYVINLWKSEDGDGYYAFNDLGVLFEVDDTGRIQSHSNIPGLNKYDGKTLAKLWSDLQEAYNLSVQKR